MDESDDGPASPVAADGLRSVAASPVAAVAAAAVTARVSPAAAPARPPPRILFAGDRKQARERRNKRFNLQQSSLYALAFAPPDSGCELLCAASSLGSIFLWRCAPTGAVGEGVGVALCHRTALRCVVSLGGGQVAS